MKIVLTTELEVKIMAETRDDMFLLEDFVEALKKHPDHRESFSECIVIPIKDLALVKPKP